MCGILADYTNELNEWLQLTPEGNVAHELEWEMIQRGPNHKAEHCATASRRSNTIQ
jgi:hypothetical protein